MTMRALALGAVLVLLSGCAAAAPGAPDTPDPLGITVTATQVCAALDSIDAEALMMSPLLPGEPTHFDEGVDVCVKNPPEEGMMLQPEVDFWVVTGPTASTYWDTHVWVDPIPVTGWGDEAIYSAKDTDTQYISDGAEFAYRSSNLFVMLTVSKLINGGTGPTSQADMEAALTQLVDYLNLPR
jgi:hypothetical protein